MHSGLAAESLILQFVQPFRIREVLAGRAVAGQVAAFEFVIHTSRDLQERWVTKGEKVIWIAEPAAARPGDSAARWTAVKALADTPENRQAVRDARPS